MKTSLNLAETGTLPIRKFIKYHVNYEWYLFLDKQMLSIAFV